MTKVYLDTSALIALSRHIEKLPTGCHTSVLAILELISSLKSERFGRVTKIFKGLNNANFEIDWRMPPDIMLASFPNIGRIPNSDIEDIKKVVEIIRNASSYQEAEGLVGQTRFPLEHFAKFDYLVSKGSVDSASKWLNANKIPDKLSGVYPVVTPAGVIESIVTRYCSHFSTEQQTMVRKSYNGSIDAFLDVMSFYQTHKMLTRSQLGKNDWMDIHHVLYTRRDGKFVTGDKNQFAYVNAVIADTMLFVDDFKKMVGI